MVELVEDIEVWRGAVDEDLVVAGLLTAPPARPEVSNPNACYCERETFRSRDWLGPGLREALRRVKRETRQTGEFEPYGTVRCDKRLKRMGSQLLLVLRRHACVAVGGDDSFVETVGQDVFGDTVEVRAARGLDLAGVERPEGLVL